MMRMTILRILPVALLLLAAGALAPDASACVTCENSQCRAIATSGALECSSGWFLGHYCNLSGDCRVGSGIRLGPAKNGYGLAALSAPAGPVRRSIRGMFGSRTETTRVDVARRVASDGTRMS